VTAGSPPRPPPVHPSGEALEAQGVVGAGDTSQARHTNGQRRQQRRRATTLHKDVQRRREKDATVMRPLLSFAMTLRAYVRRLWVHEVAVEVSSG